MNIVQLPHIHLPSFGGVQLLTHLTSKGLTQRGHNITVIAPQCRNYHEFSLKPAPGTELLSQEKFEGVRIKRIPISYQRQGILMKQIQNAPWLTNMLGGRFFSKLSFRKYGPYTPTAVHEIGKCAPDLIASYTGYYMNTYWGYLAKRKYNIPLVVMPSVNEQLPLSPQSIRLLKKADGLIAFTNVEKEYLVKIGCSDELIEVIPNAVDIEEFSERDGPMVRKILKIDPDAPVALFLGRKDGKGVEFLIKSMPLVWEKAPNAVLVLAGETKSDKTKILLNQCLNSIDTNKRSQIINIDSVSYDQRKHYYDACNVFVSISRVDSFGLAYLDAWACGKPIIAMRDGLPSSYMNEGLDSLFVNYGDVKDTADKIAKLLANPDIAITMGATGQNRIVNEFDIKQVSIKLEDFYRKIINFRKPKNKEGEN